MTQEHPITPPPEQVQKWIEKYGNSEDTRWQTYEQDIATQAARRKLKSLAEEAREAVQRMWESSPDVGDWGLIRRALERLQELEGQGDH